MEKRKVTIKYLPETKSVKVESTFKSQNLKRTLPFLNDKFRTLKKTELNSKKVFKEFFGDAKFEAYKLKAIYEYQIQE